MVRNYKKKDKPYNEAILRRACKEVSEGKSIKSISRKYKIGYGKLQLEYKTWLAEEQYEPKMYQGKRVSRFIDCATYVHYKQKKNCPYIYVNICMLLQTLYLCISI